MSLGLNFLTERRFRMKSYRWKQHKRTPPSAKGGVLAIRCFHVAMSAHGDSITCENITQHTFHGNMLLHIMLSPA